MAFGIGQLHEHFLCHENNNNACDRHCKSLENSVLEAARKSVDDKRIQVFKVLHQPFGTQNFWRRHWIQASSNFSVRAVSGYSKLRDMNFLVSEMVSDSIQRHLHRPAVSWLDPVTKKTETWNYQQLHERALGLACHFIAHSSQNSAVVVCANKSPDVYAAILACVYTRRHFVPLHPRTPPGRLREILAALKVGIVVTARSGSEGSDLLSSDEISELGFAECDLSRNADRIQDASGDYRKHFRHAEAGATATPTEQGLSYIVFTSGSSGAPKAIGIGPSQLHAYLSNSRKLWSFTEFDRITQIYELSFDPSIADIFWAFTSGACLCPFSTMNIAKLGAYMQREKPTVFGCAPSLLRLALQSEVLRQMRFPELRLSAFIGEKLTRDLTDLWSACAPASVIENHYGPAEATISVSRFVVPPRVSDMRLTYDAESIPIGKPYDGQSFALVAENLELATNGEGELFIAGTQVSAGYFGDLAEDLARNAKSFIQADWDEKRRTWYRTGDYMRQNSEGDFVFVRRIDSQVKLLGQRLELGEIEAVLAAATSKRVLAVYLWPLEKPDQASGVVAVFASPLAPIEIKTIRAQIAQFLPPAQRPKLFYSVDTPPLSGNGKLDKHQLLEILKLGLGQLQREA
jgi:D-alanine--poly(phosphoribitol) ligase subunit 1